MLQFWLIVTHHKKRKLNQVFDLRFLLDYFTVINKSLLALSRVLDIYKRVASLRGQAPVKQLHNTLGKDNSKPNGTGRSRYTAANRARFSVVGIFELFSFFQQVFVFSCVFTQRF